MDPYTQLDLWAVVKAYPIMDAGSMSEAVCVAGVTVDEPRRWVRLFPLDFRGLPKEQQFVKYQRITLQARRAKSDGRPESWTPNLGSIQTHEAIDTKEGWRRRREIMDPLMVASLCELKLRQAADKTSLGIFRPKEITDLTFEPADLAAWNAKKGLVDQQSLLRGERKELRPLPLKLRYKFVCDDDDCPGHALTFIDWEMGARCYTLQQQGVAPDEIGAALRKRFLDEVCAPDRDVRLICGNIAKYPTSFVVIGFMWPSKAAVAQAPLFV